jgi:hypothetical protein
VSGALAACAGKTGRPSTLHDIRVFQCNEMETDTDVYNNAFTKGSYSFATPQWYQYGYNGNILVAELPVSTLQSEFYLTLDAP